MKFLAVPGLLIAPPNDDIVYEVKLHTDSDSIGVLDMQIGFAFAQGGLHAVVLSPEPGNVRDSLPMIDVTLAAVSNSPIIGELHGWDSVLGKGSHTLRVVLPTEVNPSMSVKLGNVFLKTPTSSVLGMLALTPPYQGEYGAWSWVPTLAAASASLAPALAAPTRKRKSPRTGSPRTRRRVRLSL